MKQVNDRFKYICCTFACMLMTYIYAMHASTVVFIDMHALYSLFLGRSIKVSIDSRFVDTNDSTKEMQAIGTNFLIEFN